MAETKAMPGVRPVPAGSQPAARDHTATAERVIGGVLQYGVLVSLTLIVVGVALMAVKGGTGYGPLPGPEALRSATAEAASWPRTPAEVAAGVLAGKPYALMLAGLLCLIATPVLRVAISVVTFLADRDYTFALITLTVLAILVLSFLLGAAEGHG